MKREHALAFIELVQSVYISTETANFVFHLNVSDDSPIPALFTSGRTANYGIGKDRIIQKYLEMHNYEVMAIIYPFILEEPRWDGRTIFFCPNRMFESIHRAMGMFQREFIEFGYLGFAVVPVLPLYNYVKRCTSGLEKESSMTIKDSSDLLWRFLSPNQRGTVHIWMQKGPIFRPETYVTKPSRRGCRLSISDNVVIGLLAAMFRYGMRYSDFSGELRPKSVAQIGFFTSLRNDLKQLLEKGQP